MELDDGQIIFSVKEQNISGVTEPISFMMAEPVASMLELQAEAITLENDCDIAGLPGVEQMRRRYYAGIAGRAILATNFGIATRAVKQIVVPEFKEVQKRITERRATIAELEVMAINLRTIYHDEFDSLVAFSQIK